MSQFVNIHPFLAAYLVAAGVAFNITMISGAIYCLILNRRNEQETLKTVEDDE